MAYRVLKDIYDELYPVASGLLDNWVNPFTGASGTIEGISLFLQGTPESGWKEDFTKNMYLIDYYATYIIDTSGQTDRSATGTPILVGDSVRDRLDYCWEIVKGEAEVGSSGFIEQATKAWGEQLASSGEINGSGFISYSNNILGSGGLPSLIRYDWAEMGYLDNYDGNLVSIYNIPIGGAINNNTGQTDVAVDLSYDAQIDPLSAPTISGGYYTRVTGADAYLSEPDAFNTFYTNTFAAIPDMSLAASWSDNGYDGILNDASGTIVNPLQPEWAADDLLKTMQLNVTSLASGDLNILSRDIAQKIMVYLSRGLNYLHRVTYGTIDAFQTDIASASGAQPFSFTIENGGTVTPSGGAGWPILDNPFASGELDPSGSALMYNPDTPDFHWRKLVNDMDSNLIGSSDHGSLPWMLSQMRYMRYRMFQLVGQGTRQTGGRLWRSIMPVNGARYATFADLPQPGNPFFATTVQRSEEDGCFYVDADKTWYYWDRLTSQWRVAWSIDPTTASGQFPNVPEPYGVVIGKGVTALSSYKEQWDSAEFRTYYPGPPASGEWHVAPGADVYSRVAEDVYNKDSGDKLVDQDVVDTFGINLDGWTDANNPNLLGFDIDVPATQFVTQFKSTHYRMGSLSAAELMPGVTMDDIQEDDFIERILYAVPPSGEFLSGESVRQLAAILEWHGQSVGELGVGDLDVGTRPGESLSGALVLGMFNKMDYVDYVTGDGSISGQDHLTPSGISARFIGPHRVTYVDDNDPGFYGGVELKYYDEDSEE